MIAVVDDLRAALGWLLGKQITWESQVAGAEYNRGCDYSF
jgi:hypothetical protein